jgi:hypothetical protein
MRDVQTIQKCKIIRIFESSYEWKTYYWLYLKFVRVSLYNRTIRDAKTKDLLNKIETKVFAFVYSYDKRVILENFDTIPFGYESFSLLINNESINNTP